MELTGLSFWENHSERFLEMAFDDTHRESLEQPDARGGASREGCGDTLEIFLMEEDGRIRSASFETNGCLYTVACANAALTLIEGKTIGEAASITPREIADYLETLPEEEFHCAELAVEALRNALNRLPRNN